MSVDSVLKAAPANPRLTGIVITVISAFFMSLDSIFIRLSGVGGFDTSFLFGLFTAISMLTLTQVLDKRGVIGTLKAGGWPVIVSGLLMLGSALSMVMSVKHTSVANVAVIMSVTPALAALFGRLFLGEVTRKATWIAIGSVMVGIAIVVSGSVGSIHIYGDGLALIAANFVALNQTLTRKYKQMSRTVIVGMGGLFLALATVSFVSPGTYTVQTWVVMGAMGLLTGPAGRVLGFVATRYISAPEVGVVGMLKTVFAPALAFVIFAEIAPVNSFVGGAVILTAVLAYMLTSLSKAKHGA